MRDTLTKIDGVDDVSVNLRKRLATFQVDTDVSTPEEVAEALAEKTRGRYGAKVLKRK